MNAKLKSILTSAWNEPRAFFGWLTLSSSLLFGITTLFLHVGNPQFTFSSPVPLAAQMIALLSLLCFVVAFFCFLLAWIPPLRRVLAWSLKRRFFIIAFLATLIALFYATENWRGRRAWANFQTEWAVKGEYFTTASITPPPVPDDENFFCTKTWERFRFTGKGYPAWDNDKFNEDTVLSAYGPIATNAPPLSQIAKGIRTDLIAWQNYYRGPNNLFPTTNGTFTNFFPISISPQTPAKDVLLALSRYEETLQQLREAARRPHARFWINYEDGFSARFPHLSRLKACSQYLSLHAIASLAEGNTEIALDDILLSFRLGETIKSEPVLISFLVQVAISRGRAEPIWEGLVDHRWSDAQLAAICEALARENHLENYRIGMRGERAFANYCYDQINRTRDWNFLSDEEPTTKAEVALLEQTLGNSLFRLVPSGWFDQNKVSNSRMHMEFIQPAVDVERMIASPATTKRMDSAMLNKSLSPTPYNLFSHLLLPALSKAAEKSARGQSFKDLALVACLLERHFLAHKQYPETLDALVPQFITKLPHDVINGQPLKYRRTETGGFILYSVGWNEKDDGGTVAMTYSKTPTVDMTKGDWVWASEAK